ncbi:ATP-dependent helicase [Sphingomonas sp. ABOLD]|uniref:ATP-dependent RNA helicase RhlE n=1 Tax=Sphingomonas trueperi TaxID=53317 RepID=A0A7X6BEQ6_9SPHN|nr:MULTISPECIES: DEAD/DEAH box helicase [Sphingomonas]NJB99017.1 ATP-dependent RNA helicase RhlE [Sphingomonas trueperi]RSV40195.1 ATP-dependent helicase [Sphingomonas sp. ABOLD]
MLFKDLGLSETVLAALAAKGYNEATPIQAQSIPALLEGRDLLGIAQTGTGKTAAFMLPSIDRLVASGKRAQPRGCRMLVLAPTRELAAQIADNAKHYASGTGLRIATVFGGTSVHKNKTDLARGVDILVATPGRLVDLLDQCYMILLGIEILVLDEADQMLDLGFIHALRRIVKELPAKRQSLFFSATMPKSIRELASQFIHNPVEVKVTPVATTAERVEQFVTYVNQTEKQALLTMQLRNLEIDRALIFTRTKHGADRVVRLLAGNGIAANAIHGNKSQPQRERALGEFRSGKVKLMVATDIAARGIDVSGVSHVFNFELPNVPEQYVHRIGRTARAGADGIAISYCADDERPYLKDIERLTRQKLTVQPLPENFMAEADKIKSTRSPMPASRDEQNGRNGRAMQHAQGRRGDGQPGGRGRGGPRSDAPRGGEQRRAEGGPRSDQPRRQEGAGHAGAGAGAGRGPGAPKRKFNARPASSGQGRPGGNRGQGGGAGRSR